MKAVVYLMRCSFARIESTRLRVFKGDYGILGTAGEIILPEVWSAIVRLGLIVELRF